MTTTSQVIVDPIRMSRKPAAQSPMANLSQISQPPVTMTTSDGMPLNFVAKMKYFEKEIAEQKGPKPKAEKTFSYLQEHEVAQLRQEEEAKASAMTEEDLRQYRQETVGFDNSEMDQLMSSKPQVIRTAKAERRSQGQLVPPPGEKQSLSPAEERALQAEKRSAWRQARMKSLEEDAMRAQAVIQRDQRLRQQGLAPVDENTSSERVSANGGIREVETRNEQIVGLQLEFESTQQNGHN